jgi:hypothetical protein
VFDVVVNGQPVLEGFDVFAESGGRLRTVRKTVGPVVVHDRLSVRFHGVIGAPLVSGIAVSSAGTGGQGGVTP